MKEKIANYINTFNEMPQEIIDLCEKILNNKEDFVDNITKTIEIKEKIETNINKFKKEFKDQIEPKLYTEMLKPLEKYLTIMQEISNQLYKSKMQNMQDELDYIYVYVYEMKRTENMNETLKRVYNDKQSKTQNKIEEQNIEQAPINSEEQNTYNPSQPTYATINPNQNKVPEGQVFNPGNTLNNGSNEIIYATQQPQQRQQHPQQRQQRPQQRQQRPQQNKNKTIKYSYQVLKKEMEKKLEEITKQIEELNKIQNRTIKQDNELKGLKRTQRQIQNYYKKIYPKNSKKRPLIKYRDDQIHQISKEIKKTEKQIKQKEFATPSKLNVEREINQQKIDNLKLKLSNLKKKQKEMESKQAKAVETSFKNTTRRIETINNLKVIKDSFDESAYYILDRIKSKDKPQTIKLEKQFRKLEKDVAKMRQRFRSRKDKIEDFKERLENLRRKRVIAQGSEPIKKEGQQHTKDQTK